MQTSQATIMGIGRNPSDSEHSEGSDRESCMTRKQQFVFASVTTADTTPASAIPHSSKLSNHIGDSNRDLRHPTI